MRILYLHGFASGPSSRKAVEISQRLRAAGHQVEIPSLDQGNFQNLTISAMLQLVESSLVAPEPIGLIGSSLGGYLAALAAALNPSKIQRIMLLAPAFEFQERWYERMMPGEMELWRLRGWRDFYHYAENRSLRLDWRFVEDGLQHPTVPEAKQPTLIVHGTKDLVVPIEVSRRLRDWRLLANLRPVELLEVDSGHELTDQMELLCQQAVGFFRED
jgi:uncharacterized protein